MKKNKNTANVYMRFNKDLQNSILAINNIESLLKIREDVSGVVCIGNDSQFFNKISPSKYVNRNIFLRVEHTEDNVTIESMDIPVSNIIQICSYINHEYEDFVVIEIKDKDGNIIFINISCVETIMEVRTKNGIKRIKY